MNPLSLLTKGRTIRGLKAGSGPYKLGKSAVPNFSTQKSVAPTVSHPELFREPAKEIQPAPAEPSQPAQAVPSIFTDGGGTPAETPATAVAPPKSRAGAVIEWARSLISWPRRRGFHRPAIQTELALDKVKVMRNDFSQDEAGVITFGKKTGKKAAKPAQGEKAEKLTANP